MAIKVSSLVSPVTRWQLVPNTGLRLASLEFDVTQINFKRYGLRVKRFYFGNKFFNQSSEIVRHVIFLTSGKSANTSWT